MRFCLYHLYISRKKILALHIVNNVDWSCLTDLRTRNHCMLYKNRLSSLFSWSVSQKVTACYFNLSVSVQCLRTSPWTQTLLILTCSSQTLTQKLRRDVSVTRSQTFQPASLVSAASSPQPSTPAASTTGRWTWGTKACGTLESPLSAATGRASSASPHLPDTGAYACRTGCTPTVRTGASPSLITGTLLGWACTWTTTTDASVSMMLSPWRDCTCLTPALRSQSILSSVQGKTIPAAGCRYATITETAF